MEVDFPLPLSASNVFFYEKVEGMQCLARYARFDVAPADVDAAVNIIVSNNNVQFSRALPYTRSAANHGESPNKIIRKLGIAWWNADEITNGYYAGEEVSYAVRMWIDNDKGRIYLFQTD